MIIGLLVIEIYLPGSHSLKDKRQRLKRFKDRLKSRHNAALAELDFQDKWQRALFGIVTIGSSDRLLRQSLDSILREIEDSLDGEITQTERRFF